jgi:muramidase (phage lysozyme)
MPRTTGLPQNLSAFLDTVAVSELGEAILADPISDDGYRVLVGSVPGSIHIFNDYSRHPHILERINPNMASTAAGRYQVLAKYADVYTVQLKLPDFGPESQDKIAIELIAECHALADIEAGAIALALVKCSSRWASLPGAQYGQHVNQIEDLLASYVKAGGQGVNA